MGQEFLDLATALPYPPSFPPYSTTIILVTVFSRLLTVPVTLWASKRAQRYEENVLPALRQIRPVIAEQEIRAMAKEGIRGDKDYLRKVHADRCQVILRTRAKELAKEYKCRPLVTSLASPLSQAPIFIVITTMFNQLARNPASCFDSESFLTLTTLMHPDETMALPVVLGLLTMANVEASTWVLTPAEKQQLAEREAKSREMSQKDGVHRLRFQSIFKSAMRGLAVARIGLGAVAPGAVTIYWVTSAAFGLFQTWLMNWLDARRRRAAHPLPITSSPLKSPPPLSRSGSADALRMLSTERRVSSQGTRVTSSAQKGKLRN
ncbi:hypothetical protein K435DRAFT_771944 [Dendrothele bispora CBS 962.96]|uniref:Membrane insertase YidC/Oxa/ALB C-terminal domain-containing protein n=1 Tax=Dendrothele bispora (strain CBS 962.96) TaxID=1314807 RepID=A0A4S8MZ69_DENBC|nr:hypothetical protein K435DRAFT_771944 [Dendrothele bispora CBS 962.96]